MLKERSSTATGSCCSRRAICKRKGELNGHKVVATTMSNMGLEAALRGEGVSMLRAPVGDKYVLEWMRKHDASLGGEQSGHIFFRRSALPAMAC